MLLRSLLDLFFPPLCAACEARHVGHGQCLCPACQAALPRTEHALHPDNAALALFRDNRRVQRAAAWCYYTDGTDFRLLVHKLKYHRCPWLGPSLGALAAADFLRQTPAWFAGIDFIVPVPLHRRRERSRGYNQAALIAQGIGRAAGLPVNTSCLVRTVDNPTQTQRTAEERRLNVEGIFSVRRPELLTGKHILLVDDILTTGATLRSCLAALQSVRGLRVSVFTLALARQTGSPLSPDSALSSGSIAR